MGTKPAEYDKQIVAMHQVTVSSHTIKLYRESLTLNSCSKLNFPTNFSQALYYFVSVSVVHLIDSLFFQLSF